MRKFSTPAIALFGLVSVMAFADPAAANSEKTCTERMPEVRAMVDEMTDATDKAFAEKQFKKIQQLFASGRERNCILYLEALRANIESGDFSES
ncbi:hypothetical protein [Roseobacter litoralis]|uniref:Uncharacterized protein n=1 Tax=Roseobacter litoralis (strain ATCC 49566 / DSM 6996 / JCM 21268 / NBRC 15278 / OCh 149) TaxID=391595 RepID=F7ZL89_ROSLO|nr:hypothetical protein [Roseobacter litoralis]AEI95295.1 hypothetical protein RLO149_c033540 [Roseobacter litoralis Och 149]